MFPTFAGRYRAKESAKNSQNWTKKVYDDIVFDSSTISQIHPKLHTVKVHQITDIQNDLYYESVKVDGEYFLDKP